MVHTVEPLDVMLTATDRLFVGLQLLYRPAARSTLWELLVAAGVDSDSTHLTLRGWLGYQNQLFDFEINATLGRPYYQGSCWRLPAETHRSNRSLRAQNERAAAKPAPCQAVTRARFCACFSQLCKI
jgi:hypothetical protein